MKPASKKRTLDTMELEDNPNPKKLSALDTSTCHLKLLIPSAAAGAIIGKGGETIAEVQKNAGARIKMSKANDFYPGTNERVCLITGSKEAITDILGFLTEKVKEKPDPNAKPAIDFDNKITAEREKQVKVIVPNSTAGMIIGKGGNFIKHLKESSGSFIQLSQKARDTTLPERVVTVIGEEENNRVALEMILDVVQEDPQSGSCLNISYSDINGPVANFNPTGSPFANGLGGQQCSPPGESTSEAGGGGGSTFSNLNFKLNFQNSQPPTDPRVLSQCLPHLNHSLRRSGYSEKVAEEVTRALATLSVHGVLQLSPANTTESGGEASQLFLPPPPHPPPHPASQGPFGPAGLVPAPPDRQPGPAPGPAHTYPRPASPAPINLPPPAPFTQLPINNNSFGLATAGNPLPPPLAGQLDVSTEQISKVEIEVNESLVGAVLGPAGRSIVEIQQFSGANIQISKKGSYTPGTRNRVVTVTGPQKSINTAKFLIEQRVQEEEAKRQLNVGAGSAKNIGGGM